MKNRNKILKELKAVDNITAKTRDGGIDIYPTDDADGAIYGVELNQILAIAKRYNKYYYINFDGFFRMH